MNNKQLKKALLNFSNGHKLDAVAQFIGVDLKVLLKVFNELKIVDEDSANKKLKEIEAEEATKNLDGGKWDKSGKVPDFKPYTIPYKGTYDKSKIKELAQDLVPLAESHIFRRELKELDWKTFADKWTERLRVSEKVLKEEVKRFAPNRYKEIFGDMEPENA